MRNFLSGVNRDCDGTFFGIAAEDEVSGKLTCVGSVLRMREGKPALTLNIRYPVTSKGEEILAEKLRQNCHECNRNGCVYRVPSFEPLCFICSYHQSYC